jgi:hypothetical protein
VGCTVAHAVADATDREDLIRFAGGSSEFDTDSAMLMLCRLRGEGISALAIAEVWEDQGH